MPGDGQGKGTIGQAIHHELSVLQPAGIGTDRESAGDIAAHFQGYTLHLFHGAGYAFDASRVSDLYALRQLSGYEAEKHVGSLGHGLDADLIENTLGYGTEATGRGDPLWLGHD